MNAKTLLAIVGPMCALSGCIGDTGPSDADIHRMIVNVAGVTNVQSAKKETCAKINDSTYRCRVSGVYRISSSFPMTEKNELLCLVTDGQDWSINQRAC